MGIPERIGAALSIDPAADAIEFERRWRSWGDLAGAADAVASALDDAGLPPGTAVGLLLRNRPEMVAALLGVLSGNRCAVTINPHQGAGKLASDLRELRVPALLACEDDAQAPVTELARETGALGLRVSHAGALAALRGCERVGPPPHHAPLPGVAVEMLTSGTTGPPKRVQLRFAALERSLQGAKHYESQKDSKPRLRDGIAIINAPLVHVGGLWRTLQCIVDGRSFALLEKFSVEEWLDCVVRHAPRTVSLVPAALRMVLAAEIDPAHLSSVRAVLCGTAPLAPEEADAFEARFGVPVLTSYGATEFAGGVAGWNLADYRRYRESKRGSVGRAHPGCRLRVVDAEGGRPLPAAGTGLLEVRSAQLGPEALWVRTTDLARIDEDGFVWILGRADAAIIRGGFKVHPDEVRQVFERHPAVREAAVVGIPDPRLGAVPVAAVTLHAGRQVDTDTLRAHANEHLARYQVPARILVVDALPRTPSMKVSQPAVRALFETATARARA